MVVADLSNMTIPCNECWGSPRSKNEATGVKIHQTHFRVNKACQSNEQQISRCEDEREFHYDESIKSAQFSLKCSICFKNSIHAVWRGEEPFWDPGESDFEPRLGRSPVAIVRKETRGSNTNIICNAARATSKVRRKTDDTALSL